MKKHRIASIFIALFLLVCLVPSIGLLLTGGSGAAANQVLASRPALLDKEGKLNLRFAPALADYINDRFALRQQAVTLWAGLNAKLLHSSVADDVLLGRDGWLYYVPALPDYTRTRGMSERELWCAARTLALLQEAVETSGGQFLFTVAPNKSSLYDAHLPALTRQDGSSDAERLAAQLEAQGVRYLDLFSAFRAQSEELYYPRDSHWNCRGAALAADAILASLGRERVYFTAAFEPGSHRGDLYEMLFPLGTDEDPDFVYVPGFTFTASSENPDALRLNTQQAKGEGALLMYRDSFGRALYPYLAESYAEAQFSRSNDYSPDALPEGGTLIVELVERNLRYILENPPSMRSPERSLALSAAAENGRCVTLTQSADAADTLLLCGDYGGLRPDADSPVYLQAGERVFEAVPGAEGFCARLSVSDCSGALRLYFYCSGQLVAIEALVA